MKVIVFLLSFVLPCLASPADSGELYRWIDERGKIIIVDDIGEIPRSRRETLKTYQIPSRPEKEASAPEREVTEPSPMVSGAREIFEGAAPAANGREAEIEALLERKSLLAEQMTISRAQARRFGGARSTFYQKRFEEAAEELEAIERKLNVMRRGDQ